MGFVLLTGLVTTGYFLLFPHKAADETRALKLIKPDVPSNKQRIALVIGNSDYRTSPALTP